MSLLLLTLQVRLLVLKVSDMSELIKCFHAEAAMDKEKAFNYLVKDRIEGILSISAYNSLMDSFVSTPTTRLSSTPATRLARY